MNRYCFDELKHIHFLDNKTLMGTSTITNVLGKNLSWWSAELSAVECLEKGEKIETIRAEYLEAVASDEKKKAIDKLQKKYPIFKTARFAHFNSSKQKAEKGTDLHYWLEQFIKDSMGLENDFKYIPLDVYERITSFMEWTDREVKRFLYSESHAFDEETWSGGIADWGAELNDNSIVAGDFKSSPVTYESQWYQLGGYIKQIIHSGLLDKYGNKIGSISGFDRGIIVPFGAKKVVPIFNKMSLSEMIDGFISCAKLNSLKVKYEEKSW